MSRTLLPRGALSAYSAAVDHVLRVDESTCRAEGVRISSGSFIPPILVGWFRPGGPRRRSARNEGAAAQAGFPRLNPCDPYALQGVQLFAAPYDPWVGWGPLGQLFFSRAQQQQRGPHKDALQCRASRRGSARPRTVLAPTRTLIYVSMSF